MKIRNLMGERFKERPSDCVTDSHALMVRGGYIKAVANGIFSLYTPTQRITQKIEQIMREEMDRIDGQEVLFPVVLPGALWDESGRYTSVGDELLRFTDRNDTAMVLGMTHEEAAVQLVRDCAQTYTRYPFMIYQIQTKFRDEARPRAGLIRVREFTMKDAYSFHTSQEDLEQYYDRAYKAYERIFARAGVPEVIAVASDSGMMGGSLSHEFMLLTPIGEDSIVICRECDYRANMEAAENIVDNSEIAGTERPLELMLTPSCKTIEEVTEYLGSDPAHSCKAVIYQKNMTDEYVVVFLRGDMDINETKLTNYLHENVHIANVTEDCGLVAGFTGPVGLKTEGITVLYDKSLKGLKDLICGANRENYHYQGMNLERDVEGGIEYLDLAKAVDGGICPCCGKKALTVSRGIEVGNIFQLGTKYTKSMEMTYVDQNGESKYPIMGCYGIGVGRLAASICEARHDDYGPIWPISIAPWQVELCCLRADDPEAKAFADGLYDELQKQGVEVLYDDRDVRPGSMFADADLIGCPVRLIVSPKNLANGEVELVTRDKSVNEKIAKDDAIPAVKKLIAELFAAIDSKVAD